MTRLAHVLAVLGVVAVPAVGWFVEGWSGATTLVVYWFETLAGSLFIAGRILLHQRWAPRRGHHEYIAATTNRQRSKSSASFLSGFLVANLSFTAAHGVFMAVILFLLSRNGQQGLAEIDWRSVGYGCLFVMAFLCVDFVVDLAGLRAWSFRQLETLAQRGFSRVIVVHLTLILGLLAVALTDAPSTFFGVFVTLKTMASLSFVVPQWEPSRPPEWLRRAMNRVPNTRPGQRFEDFWTDSQAEERARWERNEQPWPGRANRPVR
ncbi:DUF6498-containing protein [Mycobacterium sp. ZZG]